LQNIVVLSIFFEFIEKNCENCPYLETNNFSTKTKKCFLFFLTKSLLTFKKIFLEKSFKVKKLGIYARDWLQFWKTWFELCFRAKNEFPLPKKSPKLGNFGHKKSASVLRGPFLAHLNWCPLRFFDVFSYQPTSGHAYSSRNPFCHHFCGFGRQFSKILKNRFFTKVWVFAERPVSSFCKIWPLS
jgi:hypothetical protein